MTSAPGEWPIAQGRHLARHQERSTERTPPHWRDSPPVGRLSPFNGECRESVKQCRTASVSRLNGRPSASPFRTVWSGSAGGEPGEQPGRCRNCSSRRGQNLGARRDRRQRGDSGGERADHQRTLTPGHRRRDERPRLFFPPRSDGGGISDHRPQERLPVPDGSGQYGHRGRRDRHPPAPVLTRAPQRREWRFELRAAGSARVTCASA
jgi:hypothetical protein